MELNDQDDCWAPRQVLLDPAGEHKFHHDILYMLKMLVDTGHHLHLLPETVLDREWDILNYKQEFMSFAKELMNSFDYNDNLRNFISNLITVFAPKPCTLQTLCHQAILSHNVYINLPLSVFTRLGCS